MNSRRKFEKNKTEQCITIKNLLKIETNINNYTNYIKSLKLVDKKNDMVMPISQSKRRVPLRCAPPCRGGGAPRNSPGSKSAQERMWVLAFSVSGMDARWGMPSGMKQGAVSHIGDGPLPGRSDVFQGRDRGRR